jgi:hypothetical protein
MFWSARRRLALVWVFVALFPWCLQVRTMLSLALPHELPPVLLAGDESARQTTNLTTRCPVRGMLIAGVWWNMSPTHFVEREDGRSICHFVTYQYNTHGFYSVGTNTSTPIAANIFSELPDECRGSEGDDGFLRMDLYYYHGTIGYFAFYTSGRGVFCEREAVAYMSMASLGSVDLNGAALAHDAGGDSTTPSRRYSCWYISIGSLWIAYRAVVLSRSFVLCAQFGERCERLCEPLDLHGAAVFVQETARLVPHQASTTQCLLVIYFVLEGLMADLFLQITKYGVAVRLQYFSIGYNLASLLSLLFELIVRRMTKKRAWSQATGRVVLTARRVFFNIETGFIGEVLCAGVLHRYLDGLNRSRLQDSITPVQAVSFYVWSLVAHAIVVLGLAGIILGVRAVLALAIVRVRFGSVHVLTALNSIEMTLGERMRAVMLSGYVWRDGELLYSREALKAFGLLRSHHPDVEAGNGVHESLVHIETKWWGSMARRNLVVIGRIVGNRVEPCAPRPCDGHVKFSDRALGGVARIGEALLSSAREIE